MRLFDSIVWYHQQESNLYLALRRHSFYPLNYGGTSWQVAKKTNCMRWQERLIVGDGEDQIHGTLIAGLGADGEAP